MIARPSSAACWPHEAANNRAAAVEVGGWCRGGAASMPCNLALPELLNELSIELCSASEARAAGARNQLANSAIAGLPPSLYPQKPTAARHHAPDGSSAAGGSSGSNGCARSGRGSEAAADAAAVCGRAQRQLRRRPASAGGVPVSVSAAGALARHRGSSGLAGQAADGSRAGARAGAALPPARDGSLTAQHCCCCCCRLLLLPLPLPHRRCSAPQTNPPA